MITKRSVALALTIAAIACSQPHDVAVGETHTVASATRSQRSSADWPCFADASTFKLWLGLGDNRQEQNTIEENDALWLSDGDVVKVLQIHKPDVLRIAIVSAPTESYVGKTCFTPSYSGALFSK